VSTPISGAASFPTAGPRPVVTVGNFDGVHQGHQVLLNATLEKARQLGAPAVAYTFHPAPRDVLRPNNPIPRIQSLEDRLNSLYAVGLDQVVVEAFTLEMAALSPQQFAEQILAGQLRAQALVLGWDFRYGARRAGTVDMLRDWLDIDVTQVSVHTDGSEAVSSSRIRTLVREGLVAQAATLLTRPHRLRGTVVPGDQRGRTLGFPTANVAVQTALTPARGVYAVQVTHEGATLAGVANFGLRPTFGGEHDVLEVHLLDFSEDLYGVNLAVDLVARIRGEIAFSDVTELQQQIARDLQSARNALETGQ